MLADRPLAELDDYLQRREARFPELRDGCQKQIVWHDKRVRRQLAIIYLHGFSASRAEISPVCEMVAERLQANLFFTRLTGHGQTPSALAATSVSDWLSDTCEALAIGQRLGHQLIVIGNSTGATLATWLALNRPQSVVAYVLLSPNFAVRHWLEPLFRLPPAWVLPTLFASTYGGGLTTPAQACCWTSDYPFVALRPLLELVRTVAKSNVSRIVSPLLLLIDPRDKVVDSRTTVRLVKQLRCRYQLKAIDSEDPQNHVLAGDLIAPQNNERVVALILRFIKEQSGFFSTGVLGDGR